MRLSWLLVWVAGLLAGCGGLAPAVTPTANTALQLSAPRQLATVYTSPTPNAAEQQATRFAVTATPETLPATPTATPTVYIGLFLGNSGANVPVVRPEEFGGGPPTRTPVPSRCPLTAETAILGTRWQTDDLRRALGCAIEGFLPFTGETQAFENGVIYTRNESGQAWAVAIGEPGQYWFVEETPDGTTAGDTAPPGLLAPTGDFGALWASRPEIREALGYAILAPSPVSSGVQRFEGGTLLYDADSGKVFALLPDGRAFGPY